MMSPCEHGYYLRTGRIRDLRYIHGMSGRREVYRFRPYIRDNNISWQVGGAILDRKKRRRRLIVLKISRPGPLSSTISLLLLLLEIHS
jgi:hypothetical protein